MQDVEFSGRAAYLSAADVLVVADLHVGRVAASTVAAPLGGGADVVDRLAGHVDKFAPATVVVAGDILHAHGSVPVGAGDILGRLVDTVRASGADTILVRGNHDTLLDTVDVPGDPRVVNECRLADGTVVCHGHEEPESDAPRYVVGHDHPAIRIEGARHPCFLVGEETYRGSDVLVLPAFDRGAAGTLVNPLGDALSPVVEDVGSFRPIVVGRETYEFPPLREFASLL